MAFFITYKIIIPDVLEAARPRTVYMTVNTRRDFYLRGYIMTGLKFKEPEKMHSVIESLINIRKEFKKESFTVEELLHLANWITGLKCDLGEIEDAIYEVIGN